MPRLSWRVVIGLVLIGLLLVSFVSPFSWVPNPLGLYYLIAGDYSYVPHSLFVNRFAILRGDPARALSIKLDQLIGQTGLDPLDPNQPLVSYEVKRIIGQPNGWYGAAAADVELHYADGSAQTYEIPVYQQSTDPNSAAGWAYTGLDRLFAEHKELPNLPWPGKAAPIRLNMPKRLDLAAEADLLGTAGLDGWVTSSSREGDGVRWAPDGGRFLVRTDERGNSSNQELWLVSLEGSPPRKIADKAAAYIWSSDGKHILYLRLIQWIGAGRPQLAILDVDPSTGAERSLGQTDTFEVSAVGEAVYYVDRGALWRKPLDDRPAKRLGLLPQVAPALGAPSTIAVSPDGQRVAYYPSGSDIFLTDTSGENVFLLSLGYPPQDLPTEPRAPVSGPVPTAPIATLTPEKPIRAQLNSLGLAWSHDGQKLAVTTGSYSRGPGWSQEPQLWVVDLNGKVQQKLSIGPDGVTREPQWTADDRFVILNTFPAGGRRIVAAEVATGKVLDLSQPRWDAFASLAPDGRELLLWNGRGGFWMVSLEERSEIGVLER